MTDAARLKSTIYVGGLTNDVNERILSDAFIPFGEIVEISLPKPELPSSNDPHRGFGYVEFETTQDAKEAIDNMDQSELFGRVIKVAAAKPQKDANAGLGSKTAVWEQEGYLAKYAVSEEDRMAAEQSRVNDAEKNTMDPMQGLEGLDVEGPQEQ